MEEKVGRPAQWALEEAAKRSGWYDSGLTASSFEQSLLIAHARTIETHEQPPVDPDVLAVREILAAWYGKTMIEGESILRGEWDDTGGFQPALTTYRRAKNGGAS